MSGLTNAFPSGEEAKEIQAAGWSLVATSGQMACVKKDESGDMLPWPQALARVRSEQAEAKKARR